MRLLGRALALVVIGVGLGLALNAVRSDGIALRGNAGAAACTVQAAAPTVEVLPPTQAVRLCGDPGVLVADARPAARFAEGHVADALHLPCTAAGTVAAGALAQLAGKHTLIVYGDSTDEARPVAEDLRRRIAGGGASPAPRVIVLDGGFPAWSRAGLACSSGEWPGCAEKARK
jgi:3-mercaptopyruvate sulfurtransferase SseA